MKYSIFGLMLLISSFASAMQQNNQNNQNSQQAPVSPNTPCNSALSNIPDENGVYRGVLLIPPSATFERPRTPFVLRQRYDAMSIFGASAHSNNNWLQNGLNNELNNNSNNNH